MGSYQRQRSRSTVGIEPHIRLLKTYKKERPGKHVKRERESERERWEKRYLWTIDQNIRMVFFLNIPVALSLFCPC